MTEVRFRDVVGAIYIGSSVELAMNKAIGEVLESGPLRLPLVHELALRFNKRHREVIEAINASTKTVLENP